VKKKGGINMDNTIDLAVELEKLFTENKQGDFKPFDLSKELVNKMDNIITIDTLLPLEMKEAIDNKEIAEIPFEVVS
jgi:hypothetical protein